LFVSFLGVKTPGYSYFAPMGLVLNKKWSFNIGFNPFAYPMNISFNFGRNQSPLSGDLGVLFPFRG